jgi:hypothetical protein
VDEEPRPDGDQHRSDVLDDEGDSDVEMRDGREVEKVDEGEPGHAEQEEKGRARPLDAQALRADERDRREEDQPCPGRASSASLSGVRPPESTITFAIVAFSDQRPTGPRTST